MLAKRDFEINDVQVLEFNSSNIRNPKIVIPSISSPLATFNEFVFMQIDKLSDDVLKSYYNNYYQNYIRKRLNDQCWEFNNNDQILDYYLSNNQFKMMDIKLINRRIKLFIEKEDVSIENYKIIINEPFSKTKKISFLEKMLNSEKLNITQYNTPPLLFINNKKLINSIILSIETKSNNEQNINLLLNDTYSDYHVKKLTINELYNKNLIENTLNFEQIINNIKTLLEDSEDLLLKFTNKLNIIPTCKINEFIIQFCKFCFPFDSNRFWNEKNCKKTLEIKTNNYNNDFFKTLMNLKTL